MSDKKDKELKTRRFPNPKEDIEALEDNLTKAQQNLAGAVQEIGNQLEVVKVTKPYWGSISGTLSGAVASGAIVLHTLREQSEELAKESEKATRQISSMSGTATYFVASAIPLSQMYPVSQTLDIHQIQQVTMQRTEQDFVERELRKIDNALANTYATVWQYMHYPGFDPARGPLFLMRQVFDHLLDKLAPDSEVESQPDFLPDADLKKRNGKGITRNHRIEYIAKSKVHDIQVRQNLLNTSKNFLDIYGNLNEAHTRGALKEDYAKDAVYAGSALLAIWLRALSKN